MARNRITYASQSVWANGELLYRVQSLGTTTTFTSEDIFELGHLDIVDIVDDVPSVAVTMNTNDFGDVKTLATLAQVALGRKTMTANASQTNANLVSGATYLHGVCLADFAVVCGNLPGVTMWAPVQSQCDIGTLANNIDQTLFLDDVFVNSLEFSYTQGANATENYGAETDNKMWLLNNGRFVNYLDTTVSGTDVANGYIVLADMGYDATSTIPTLSTGNLGFLRKDANGNSAVTFYDASTVDMKNIAVQAGTSADVSAFVFDTSNGRLWFPSGLAVSAGDIVQMVFSADKYSAPMNKYFSLLTASERPNSVGTLRQGQVEIYLYDPSVGGNLENMWRLTGATLSVELTREPLSELGRLGPYDRPLTMPIPITATIESTAGDLENWAKFAGQDFTAIDDIDLTDLMTKDNLILVIKVFRQTDEEAGGTGSGRKALTINGDWYMEDGVAGTYALATNKERALKTIIVKNLKITDEGMTLDMGANATQTFGFRSNNDLFVVKGDISAALLADIARNAS